MSTPSWPPRFPSSQVRLPPLLGRELERGPLLFWLYRVGAGGYGAERSQMPFFGTISFGLQPSGSFSLPSPRLFQTSSLRRPQLGPPPHRWPGAQLSSEGRHRLSSTFFPTPSSTPPFPISQVRLPRLGARACMAGRRIRGLVRLVGRARDTPRPRFLSHRSRGVQASLLLSGWSLR